MRVAWQGIVTLVSSAKHVLREPGAPHQITRVEERRAYVTTDVLYFGRFMTARILSAAILTAIEDHGARRSRTSVDAVREVLSKHAYCRHMAGSVVMSLLMMGNVEP
jgi:hypothetical protein